MNRTLLIISMLALGACGSDDSDGSDPTESETVATTTGTGETEGSGSATSSTSDIGSTSTTSVTTASSSATSSPPQTSTTDATSGTTTSTESGVVGIDCEQSEAAVPVALQTEDGLMLEADFYSSGISGGKAVFLLHMIPPGNDKSNYTPEFINALRDAGFSVLNVNRRGAGASEGDPMDAYMGLSGRLDAVAAHDFLTMDGCGTSPSLISAVGASNGTTTVTDFAVGASAADQLAAMVLLSPGRYTESQNTYVGEAETLSAVPMYFGFPDSESEWPEAMMPLDSGSWTFREFAGGGHGTQLFTSHPEIIAEIAAFLDG